MIKTKGISLIVLVITIIVMIIIAGAIILSLSNGNVIAKAKLAKESNDFTGIKEMVEMEKGNAMFPGATYNTSNTPVPSAYANDISITSSGGILLKQNANTKIANISSAIEKLDAAYIPTGFYYVGGKVDTGIVISDNAADENQSNGLESVTTVLSGNQFVWVPVYKISGGYIKRSFGQAITLANYLDATSSYDATNTVDFSAISTSIATYGGFYIARYEASAADSSSKANQVVNFTLYGNCRLNAKNFASSTTNGKPAYTSVLSNLPTGAQFDTIVQWMSSVPNINPALGLYINNPTNMGHFGNMSTVKINTGVIATNYQVYNIFDLAGNMAEFTAETGTTTTNRIIRGGTNSAFKGSPAGVWTRSEMPDFDPMGLNSYRVALYIK